MKRPGLDGHISYLSSLTKKSLSPYEIKLFNPVLALFVLQEIWITFSYVVTLINLIKPSLS